MWHIPRSEIESTSLLWQVDSLPLRHQESTKCTSFKEVEFLTYRIACFGGVFVFVLFWQMLAQKSGNIINMSSVASSIKGRRVFLWES